MTREMTPEELDLFASNWSDPETIKAMGAPYDWNFVISAMANWWVTLDPDTNDMLARCFPSHRCFELVRDKDVSGVSGIGVVAEGAQFSTGKCVLAWTTRYQSVAVYDNIDELIAIHGHDGATRVRWL